MTMRGAESFNGPVNTADMNAKGYWAGANSITGAGVPYGNPLQYRSIQRSSFTTGSTFPFASVGTVNDQIPVVMNLGLAQDYYTAGGFWTGITAEYLGINPVRIGTDGTKLVGMFNPNYASGATTTDFVHWNAVTNSAIGTAFTLNTPVNYKNGAYFFGGQLGSLIWCWASGTDVPGTFTTTQLTTAVNNGFMNNMVDFRMMSVGGTGYYGAGYISSPGIYPQIVRSTTGATGSFTAVLTDNTVNSGQVLFLYELGMAMYATGSVTIGSTSRGVIYRSTDGTTWTRVYTNTSVNDSTTQRLAYDGNQTVVAVGSSGSISTSTDNGVTWVVRTSNVPVTERIDDIAWTGTQFIGITNQRNNVTSPDGLTWTYTNNALMGSLSQAAMRIQLVGGQYYAYSETSTSGLTTGFKWDTSTQKWICIRAADNLVAAIGSQAIPIGTFFGTPGASPAAAITGGRSMAGFMLTTTGVHAVAADGVAAWNTSRQQFTTDAPANLSARLEMRGVAVPAQAVPTFDITWYYNGMPSTAPFRVTATAGQSIFFCLSTTGFNLSRDFVYGDMSGTRNNTVIGDVRIIKKPVTLDVGTPQWEKVPAGIATNALAASGNGSMTMRTTSVQSSAVNNLDEYNGAAAVIPAGYKISAVKVEAGAQRTGIPTPTVTLGVIDNGAALPVATANLTGTTTAIVPMRQVYETTIAGQSWTNDVLATSTVAIKRTA